MKQNIFKSICTGTLALLILSAFATTSAFGLSKGAKALEGSWTVQITVRNCQTGEPLFSFPRMNTFNEGGTMHEFAAAVSPSLRGPGHGVWSHSNKRTFSYALQFLRFNADGTFGGSVRERRSVEVSHDGDTYSATGTGEIFNAAGIRIASTCATEEGTRFE